MSEKQMELFPELPPGMTILPGRYNGYVRCRFQEEQRLFHHVLMELSMGRKLRPDECVHHVNGIRDDNRLENLWLLTQSQHSRLHNRRSHRSAEAKIDWHNFRLWKLTTK